MKRIVTLSLVLAMCLALLTGYGGRVTSGAEN